MYTYVANEIEYLPYYGSKKDAETTFITGLGNDWDQASLLIALFRASNLQVSYTQGIAVYSVSFLASVLGVEEDKQLILQILANGGYKDVAGYENDFIQMRRVWVSFTYEGITYALDPAFSPVQNTPGIDLEQAMDANYASSDIYNAATQGATITPDYASDINETAVRSLLDTYAMNFITWLNQNQPGADMETVIGFRSIIKENKNITSQLPGAESITNVSYFDIIPDTERFKLSIQCFGFDKILYGHEICGKALKIEYENDHPVLKLNDDVIATGTPTVEDYSFIDLAATHPYATQDFDQTTRTYFKSRAPHVITVDIGGSVSSKMIRERLDQYRSAEVSGLAGSMHRTFDITGMNFLNQVHRTGIIQDRIADCVTVRHHKIGILGQEEAPFMDMRLGRQSMFSMADTGSSHRARHFAGTGLASALEHLAIEQAGVSAVSSIKAIVLNNRSGGKTYFARASNYWDAHQGLRAQFLSRSEDWTFYSKWTGEWGQMINSGKTILIPENRKIECNDWKGHAFIAYDTGPDLVNANIRHQIGGGFIRKGGHGTEEKNAKMITMNTRSDNPVETVGDPVDIISGYFMHSRTDLGLGNGMPVPLSFKRFYVSAPGVLNNNTGLGHGWTHNLDIRIEPNQNNPDAATGARTPVEAAALIIGSKAMQDLESETPEDPMRILISGLVQQWMADQMTDNSVTIHLNGNPHQYTRLPDGSYAPPPGMNATLTREADNTFLLTGLNGTRYVFNADNRIDIIEDAHGNQLDFEYTGTRLNSVTDRYGRAIYLDYNDGMIAAVRDSTGRHVGFEYDANNNLETVWDTENRTTTYAYDNDHRLLKQTSPLGIDVVVNRYDELGRVREQDVPWQHGTGTYQYFYNGARHRMIKPSGEEVIYNLDHKKRIVSIRDGLGNSNTFEYDGRNNTTKHTDPEGNETRFTYDFLDRVTSVTNALDETTEFEWNAANDLETVTDPLDHITSYEYTRHLPAVVRTFPSPEEQTATTVSYYDNGLASSTTDGVGHTTHLNYIDGLLQTSQVASHSAVTRTYDPAGYLHTLTDQAGAVTTFTRDTQGLVTHKTDPLDQTTQYEYDYAGRPLWILDRNGEQTDFEYTPNGKLESVSYADGTRMDLTYHPLHDTVETMTDASGTTEYTYDLLGRVKNITGVHGFTISYDYDKAGNVTGITYPGNRHVTYTYDALTRLETVTTWTGHTATYIYDPAGRLTDLIRFNGTRTEYGHDNANRLTRLSSVKSDQTLITSFDYTLNGAGNRTQIVETVPLTAVPGQGTTAFTFNTLKNRIKSAGNLTITHDDEGQITTKGSSGFTFDPAHRLTAVTGISPVEYTYNGINYPLLYPRSWPYGRSYTHR